MKNSRPIEDSDVSLLASLSDSAFSPAVSDGKWEMEKAHMAKLTLRLPPIGSFRLPLLHDLEKALDRAGLSYEFQGATDHLKLFSVMRLKVFEIDPQRFEQNKADLRKSLIEYGEAITSQIRKAIHHKFIDPENKPPEFFER